MLSTALKLLVVLIQTHLFLAQKPVVVQLPNGLISGFKGTTIASKTFYGFRGIPFAAPPVGNLRFQAPRPALDWNGTRDATQMNTICFQASRDSDQESEDCLFVNVFTPQLPSKHKPLLPVMVYIHGGGFQSGSGMSIGPDLFVNNGVVFAAINYRLGIFGFLSTQDDIIPGNNGLKDQQLALKWVHDNICLFGGDPERVTIFGQSSGAASVGYQLLNQANNGLFRAAILESGSPISPMAYQRHSKEIAFTIASYLNSTFNNSTDSQALLDYFLTLEPRKLDSAAKQYHDNEFGPKNIEIFQGCYFAPVVEVKNPTAFLTTKMYKLLEQNNILAVPIIIGITSEEAIGFDPNPVTFQATMAQYDQHLDWLVPNDMHISDNTNRIEMGRKIRSLYTNGKPFSEHLGDAVRYASDTSLSRSVIKHAELSSNNTNVFFYIFSYDGQLGRRNITHYNGAGTVGHATELAYLFCSGDGCADKQYPEGDRLTRQRLIKLWTNFAKNLTPTAFPNPSELLQHVYWNKINASLGNFEYLDIGKDLAIKSDPKNKTYPGWVKLYDGLDFKDFDTY